LHKQYGNDAEFLGVYVREAHPTDGWRMDSNDIKAIAVPQPLKLADRLDVAKRCCATLQLTMPLLVDGMDDHVGQLYSGMPDRIYVIDRAGRVAYKGGRGPFGYKPREMEQSLLMLLLEEKRAGERQSAVPLDSDAEAWKHLPRAERGAGRPLPVWARALARTLPRTTAAMLELDYLQRTRNELGPKMRARMRWVAAHANRCRYSEAEAEADLRRAGVDEGGIRALARGETDLPSAERLALAFARKMTLAAHTVSDAEVERLIQLHGPRRVVAMVLLLAYANFQDRLLLSLDLAGGEDEPLPPLDVRFRAAAAPPVPVADRRRPAPAGGLPPAVDLDLGQPWAAGDFGRLQEALERQRGRGPRIPVPAWEEVRKHLPPDSAKRPPLRIRWSLVCLGYQPELARGWSACLRAFDEESRLERAFEESIFWVVTRSLQCFY
jgi:alkylhydroperoxidase family enzyme